MKLEYRWFFIGFTLFNYSLNAQVTTPVFTEVSIASGISLTHQTSQTVLKLEDSDDNSIRPLVDVDNTAQLFSSWLHAGLAAADYNGDGWDDLFIIGGDLGQNRLMRNDGNGYFTDVTKAMGLDSLSGRVAGAVFADIDGDNDLDLFVGGALGEMPRLLVQQTVLGRNVFVDNFSAAFPGYDITTSPNTWGGIFGDYNNDNCVDIFMPHSLTPPGPLPARTTSEGSTQHLWQGNCKGQFMDVSVASGISALFEENTTVSGGREQTFSGQFVDLNNNGWQDLVIAGDIATSLILRNQGDGTFADETDRTIITDFNAMGSALLDANLDGHLDWFNSNIYRPNSPNSRSNHLYLGDGLLDEGVIGFSNVTVGSGLEAGLWGWSSCAADFNLDSYPDIFHVTGFYVRNNQSPEVANGRFDENPARLFINQTGEDQLNFEELSVEAGVADIGEGRGVACFDYDQDGDIDIAISNYAGQFKLYRNDTFTEPLIDTQFLHITLAGNTSNTEGLGANIRIRSENPTDGEGVLTRTIQAGNHFNSASPAIAHFGLGNMEGPFIIEVRWPGNTQEVLEVAAVSANQRLELPQINDQIYRLDFE